MKCQIFTFVLTILVLIQLSFAGSPSFDYFETVFTVESFGPDSTEPDSFDPCWQVCAPCSNIINDACDCSIHPRCINPYTPTPDEESSSPREENTSSDELISSSDQETSSPIDETSSEEETSWPEDTN